MRPRRSPYRPRLFPERLSTALFVLVPGLAAGVLFALGVLMFRSTR